MRADPLDSFPVRKEVKGFDYRTHEPVAKPGAEWVDEIGRLLKAGHASRVGTVTDALNVYGPNGRILFELYYKD